MDNAPIFGMSLPKERRQTRHTTPFLNWLNSSAHEVRSFRGLFRFSETIPDQKSAHPFSGIDEPDLPHWLGEGLASRSGMSEPLNAKPLHSDMLPYRVEFILLEVI